MTESTDSLPDDIGRVLVGSVEDAYIQVFRALGDPVRMQIFRLIASAEPDEFPCTSLEDALTVSKSTISYHVKILTHAGLITVRRNGRYFSYRTQPTVANYFVPRLLERLDPSGSE